MVNITPIVRGNPDMKPGELLSYPCVSLDGTPFLSMPGVTPRRWHVAGMGFVGGLMEPFTDAELLEKSSHCANIAVLPDLDGNIIVVVKGCDELVKKFA